MSSAVRSTLVVVLVALLACFAMAGTVATASKRPRKKPVKREQPAVAPQPAPRPLQPLTLEQMPALPPQVSYHDGSLTIIAENSTLGDVLRAVRAKTGAAVDIPANATERVVSHVGPGPAREVMAALLNGSHFNYVMLGSATNPRILERVVLLPKSGGAESGPSTQAMASEPVYSPPQARMPRPVPPAQEPDEVTSDEEFGDELNESESDNLIDEQANQPAEPTQPGGQPTPRTPEQLLQELQRQQQQLQQQGNPQGFPVPPGQPPQPQPEQPPQ